MHTSARSIFSQRSSGAPTPDEGDPEGQGGRSRDSLSYPVTPQDHIIFTVYIPGWSPNTFHMVVFRDCVVNDSGLNVLNTLIQAFRARSVWSLGASISLRSHDNGGKRRLTAAGCGMKPHKRWHGDGVTCAGGKG